MSDNRHIRDFLEYYCIKMIRPGFGVIIKGPWGAGKTYLVKEILDQMAADLPRYVYISLYGVRNTRDIDGEIFRQIHPVLGSPKMAFAGRVMKGFLRGTLKIDIDGDSKEDASISMQLPDANIMDAFSKPDRILVFDDLERCSMPLVDALGYINYFIEHLQSKVIVIANEEEIYNNEKADGFERYSRVREKLLGRSFEIVPSFDSAIESFKKCVDNKVEAIITNVHNEMRQLFRSSSHTNLRSVRHCLQDFEHIFLMLPARVSGHREAMQQLLKVMLCLYLEYRAGTLSREAIETLGPSAYFSRVTKGDAAPSITEKYLSVNFTVPMFQGKTWANILIDGIFDRTSMESDLFNCKFFVDSSRPSWIELWYWNNIEEKRFNELLTRVESDFVMGWINDPGHFLHVVGILMFFSRAGLASLSLEDIVTVGRSCLSAMAVFVDMDDQSNLYDFERGFSGGLGFHSSDDPDFRALIDHFQHEIVIARTLRYPKLAAELSESMSRGDAGFFKDIMYGSEYNGRYWDVPIFKYVDVDDFVQRFRALAPEAQRAVIRALRERHTKNPYADKISEEIPWIRSVVGALSSQHFDSEFGKFRLRKLIEANIGSLIEETGPRSA